LRSSSLDRAGPDPHLVLVGWSAEPDLDRSFGPGDRVCLHQFLYAVLPYDPGEYARWVGRCGDAEVPDLLRLQAPGLAQGEARAFCHRYRVSNKCPTGGNRSCGRVSGVATRARGS